MSTPVHRVGLLGMLAVVAFDAIASLASLAIGFNYEYSAFGSLLLYCVFGYWASSVRTILFASIVGALMGLTDASLGWAVSWILGPGRWEPGLLTLSTWALIALQITAVAAICALLGGVARRYMPRGKRTQA